MQIWLVTITAENATPVQALARSEKEAREKATELGGEKPNGRAEQIDVATDKDGIIALFERKDFIKNTLKTFAIVDGKFKSRD